MWQNDIFGMHWQHQDKMYYDELSAESQDEAADYFIDHMRDDISLARVELVGHGMRAGSCLYHGWEPLGIFARIVCISAVFYCSLREG
jgi:hypothetical protein